MWTNGRDVCKQQVRPRAVARVTAISPHPLARAPCLSRPRIGGNRTFGRTALGWLAEPLEDVAQRRTLSEHQGNVNGSLKGVVAASAGGAGRGSTRTALPAAPRLRKTWRERSRTEFAIAKDRCRCLSLTNGIASKCAFGSADLAALGLGKLAPTLYVAIPTYDCWMPQ